MPLQRSARIQTVRGLRSETSPERRIAQPQSIADPQPVAAALRRWSSTKPQSIACNPRGRDPLRARLWVPRQRRARERATCGFLRIAVGTYTLVGISGINGSGKGYLTRDIDRRLRSRGFTVAVINVDGWLRLPHERFSSTKPAEHFYLYAFRFDEMFEKLVIPLRERRRVSIEADFAEETASAYRKKRYECTDIDVILLEGIYLLKREHRRHYGVSLWID